MRRLPPTVTVTATSVSVFSPWFWTCTSKARSSATVMRGGAAGRERLAAERDGAEPVAVQAGRRGAAVAAARGDARDAVGHRGRVEPVDLGQERRSRARFSSPARPSSLSAASMLGAARAAVDHVAREELSASGRRCRRCSRAGPGARARWAARRRSRRPRRGGTRTSRPGSAAPRPARPGCRCPRARSTSWADWRAELVEGVLDVHLAAASPGSESRPKSWSLSWLDSPTSAPTSRT